MIQTRMFDPREKRLELVAGIGADPHEGAGAERQQPGIAGQEIEPDRRQREDQERDHHRVEQELVAGQRDDDEGDEEDQREADSGPGGSGRSPCRPRRSSCIDRLRDRTRVGSSARPGPVAALDERGPRSAIAATARRSSNSLNDLLPEQTLRAEQQEGERDDIGEPALDAAAAAAAPSRTRRAFRRCR